MIIVEVVMNIRDRLIKFRSKIELALIDIDNNLIHNARNRIIIALNEEYDSAHEAIEKEKREKK